VENTYTEYKTDGTKIYYTNGKIDRSIKPDGSQVYYTDENIYTEHKIDGTVILYKNGKITSKRNPDGSYSIYNDEGILCKEVKSDSSVIYYENGKVVKQMNTDGSYYFYDEDGIMYRHDKADGSYTYYVDENIYFEKDVYGTETHYENGKITKQVNADGSYSRYVYNNDGVIIKQENSDGSYFVYDDAGIMTEYHKADGSWTYYWFEDVYTDYLVDGSLIYYSFGKISKRVYPDGNSVNFKYFDDKEVAYSVDNSMLWEKYYDGGYNYYIDGNKWILSPDGTCEVKTNSDLKKYIYKINDDGSIEFTDLDTLERKVYNSSNELVMVRDANGNYINYENNSKVNYSSTNNKITVSNRNSIDFDEEKYNMIMRKLLSIYEGHSSIETYYNNVVSEVQKFPDYFSGLNTIGKMFEFYENIKGLKEKINYSSLAYKGYDEDLKDYLDNLVDEIFSLGQSNYETKFYDLVNENTGDLDNDGIIEYNENTNFKNFDRSMLENILVSKYGLELIYPDLILKKTLWINPDQDVIVSPVIKSINGIEFPCYYVFDLSNIDDPQKLIDNTEKCMQFTGEKYSNVDLLKSLKDKGYKFVFDDIPDIYGAAWCVASQELIKVHCCTDMWGEQYVVDALSHELGHAVDHSLIPDDNEKYYGNIIRSSYDNGNPMYLRINIPKTNDKYISIKYRSDGSAYCESLTGEVIEVNSNVINNNEVIVVDGYEYIIASKDEAINHSSEVFAETTRYNYIDKGVLLSRITASGRDRDDAYQLTTDCLTWYLSEYQNEDISWYINYLDEGDNNNER